MHATAHGWGGGGVAGGFKNVRREPALKVYPGRKITCCTGNLTSLRNMLDATLIQLSYVPVPLRSSGALFCFFCPGVTLFIIPNYSRLEQIWNRTRPKALVQYQPSRELICAWNTYHKLHACQVRVTVGDSGLCCCTCVTCSRLAH